MSHGGTPAPGEFDGSGVGDERAADAVDPDVDVLVPAQRAEVGQGPAWPVLSAISAGGAVGAAARYGAQQLWPTPAGTFPWTVFWVNVLGCALIGVLMPLVAEGGRSVHPLVRPFLGVGVLGGFTTFSTYALDVTGLLRRGAAELAVAYAAGTLLAALAAVWAGAALTRRVAERGKA